MCQRSTTSLVYDFVRLMFLWMEVGHGATSVYP